MEAKILDGAFSICTTTRLSPPFSTILTFPLNLHNYVLLLFTFITCFHSECALVFSMLFLNAKVVLLYSFFLFAVCCPFALQFIKNLLA